MIRAMRPAFVAVPLVAALALAACTKTGPQACPSLERPSARSQVDAVLVPDTNQIYALGGAGPQLPLDELWRYSFGACGGWTRLVLPSSPGARANYAATLDSMRSRIIYLGGGGSPTNDVWALDTNRLTFTKLAAVGTPPVQAASEVAAYDVQHDRVVYAGIETYALEFGGSEQGQWVFVDGTSLQAPAYGVLDPTRALMLVLDVAGLHGFSFLLSTWRDLTMSGDVPPAGAELLWDDAAAQLLAVASDGSVYRGSLDANGSSAVFTAVSTTNAPPPRRAFAVAVSGTTLWLSGGLTPSGCTLDDLWTLDLDSLAWTNVWPATTCM